MFNSSMRFSKRKKFASGGILGCLFIIIIYFQFSKWKMENPSKSFLKTPKYQEYSLFDDNAIESKAALTNRLIRNRKFSIKKHNLSLNKKLYDVSKDKRRIEAVRKYIPVERKVNQNKNRLHFEDDARQSRNQSRYIPQQRLVHLDLKGAPPKIAYLIQFLTLAKGIGATGVLLEYEDMFPFDGILSEVAASNHYTKSDIVRLTDACSNLNLDVIPLVQTFGHMEFILKLRNFAYLRDDITMPESICSCHYNATDVVQAVVDQVLAMHANSKFIHIGCDEVFHMGACESCQNQSRTDIFVNHVSKMAKYIREQHKKDVIIWDDMMRFMTDTELQPLGQLIEPMIWVYAEKVTPFMPSYTWDKYAKIFDNMWTASAFKGANGPTLTIPTVRRHLNNNLAWLDLMSSVEQSIRKQFRGIVLTGWQRYDHFAVLCELLPIGVPSLIINLIALSKGYINDDLSSEVDNAFECSSDPYILEKFSRDSLLSNLPRDCNFPGSRIFHLGLELMDLESEINDYIKKSTIDEAWMTDYNVRHNFSSPFRVDSQISNNWQYLNSRVISYTRRARIELSQVFDAFTTVEWIEQKVYPLHEKLKKLKANGDLLYAFTSWKKRPLKPSLEVVKFLKEIDE